MLLSALKITKYYQTFCIKNVQLSRCVCFNLKCVKEISVMNSCQLKLIMKSHVSFLAVFKSYKKQNITMLNHKLSRQNLSQHT